MSDAKHDLAARFTALFIDMQIIVLIQSNHRELGGKPTPEPYGSFINGLAALSLDVVQMMPADCMVESNWSHYDSLLLETLTPMIVLTVALTVNYVQTARGGGPDSHAKEKFFGYFYKAILLFLASISRRVCQTFQCREFDDGEYSLLVADLGLSCKSDTHQAFVLYSVLMVLVYPVAVPLTFHLWLRQFKDQLDDKSCPQDIMIQERKANEALRRHPIGNTALRYKPRFWWFTSLSVVRRLALTSLVLVFTQPAQMLIFVLLVSLLLLVVEREAEPYLHSSTCRAVYILQWQVILFIQALLLIDADLTNSAGALTIGVSLLLLNLFMVLVICFGARETVTRTRRLRAALKRKSSALFTQGKRPSALAAELQVEMRDITREQEDEEEQSDGDAPAIEIVPDALDELQATEPLASDDQSPQTQVTFAEEEEGNTGRRPSTSDHLRFTEVFRVVDEEIPDDTANPLHLRKTYG